MHTGKMWPTVACVLLCWTRRAHEAFPWACWGMKSKGEVQAEFWHLNPRTSCSKATWTHSLPSCGWQLATFPILSAQVSIFNPRTRLCFPPNKRPAHCPRAPARRLCSASKSVRTRHFPSAAFPSARQEMTRAGPLQLQFQRKMHIGNYKEMPCFLSVYGQWETGESRPLHGHFCQNLNEKVLRGPCKGRRVKLLNCQEQAGVRALWGNSCFQIFQNFSEWQRRQSVPCQEPRERFHLAEAIAAW